MKKNVRNEIIVSIIIPTYNTESFVYETVNSVLSQKTNFQFEVLIGDDGSTDSTPNIIDAFTDVRVHKLLRKQNIGGQRNRNDLYLKAAGKYIAVLDGDDLMYPGKLQKQYNYLELHDDCDSVFHNMDIVVNNTVVGRFNVEPSMKKYSREELIERGTFLAHTSKMFRRRSLPEKGFPIYDNLAGLDFLHHVITGRSGKLGYLPDVLGAYIRRSNSRTSSMNSANILNFYKGHEKALLYARSIGVDEQAISKGYAKLAADYLAKAINIRDSESAEYFRTVIKGNEVVPRKRFYAGISRIPILYRITVNITNKLQRAKTAAHNVLTKRYE